MQSHLRTLAETVAWPARSYWGFLAAVVVILAWGLGWVVLDFSETWHRGFDVLATAAMLLLIFGLEVTQHRSNAAIHLKLDELLRAGDNARTEMVKTEERTDEELEALNESTARCRPRSPTVAGSAPVLSTEYWVLSSSVVAGNLGLADPLSTQHWRERSEREWGTPWTARTT